VVLPTAGGWELDGQMLQRQDAEGQGRMLDGRAAAFAGWRWATRNARGGNRDTWAHKACDEERQVTRSDT
jgi:hypothetical protein